VKPKRLLEVGTWNGDRALQFAKLSPGMEYVGFDLFETASDETDKIEKNVKKHFSRDEVSKKLGNGGLPNRLYRGDSKEQLRLYVEEYGPGSADFIYIDGGHSVETIKADLEASLVAIKKGGVIVMDDYYTDMPKEELERFGAQAVLDGIEHLVIPTKDPVAGGGFTQLAVITC
jgi:predicted O-methyltransferase YrrM